MTRQWRTCGLLLAMTAAAVGSSGCALLYFAAGPGKEKAQYKFGKEQKVLVLVDVKGGITVPPYFSATLADKIGAHLYTYHAIEHLVNQAELLQFQKANPDTYQGMGVADVAEGTHADVVLYVNVKQMSTPTTSDGSVGDGHAAATIKVIDRQGHVSFTSQVAAADDPAMTSDRDTTTTVKDMIEQLSMKTGRMFHDYSLEDKNLHAHEFNPRH